MLDGLVSASVTLIAGAPADLAARIGLAMTFLQLGIGTVNDVVDAPRDAGRKVGKPIPAGLVTARAAMNAAVALFGAGLLLALSVSSLIAALAVVVIAIGLVYDLRLKGTAWSWLPFAVGIPILPVFGWLGATGELAPAFAFLLPAAVAAGAGLAIGNALVDVDRDRAAGTSSIAAALGPTRSAWVATTLFGAVWIAAVATALTAGRAIVPVMGLAVAGFVPVAAGWVSVTASSGRRERLWQLEAISLAGLAAIWVGVMVGNPAWR
ncbi:MAG: UbiA prenyltransferase family protein [Chloroflexi bacterium]|nr:UbiA prenyltransferase family protein [Chloroflexota bacterium]